MRGVNPIPQFAKVEADFLNRQRELQDLHYQLKSVLDSINDIAPVTDSDFNLGDTSDNSCDDLVFVQKTELSADQQTRLLIREIQQLQVDVEEVRASLMERCRGTKKTHVALIMQRLTELEQTLDAQIRRAENLIQ